MLYVRRLVDLLLISTIPSLFTMIAMTQFAASSAGQLVWILMAVFNLIIFYSLYILLLRRFIFDIKRKDLYFKVQLVSWAIATALSIFMCQMKLGNALSSMFSYARFYEMISPEILVEEGNRQVLKHTIRTIWSLCISSGVNLALIFAMYFVFIKKKNIYDEEKKLDQTEIDDIEIERLNEEEYLRNKENAHRREKTSQEYTRRYDIGDDELISKRMSRKLDMLDNLDDGELYFRKERKKNKKYKKSRWDKILNLWSYEFYQYYLDRLDEGIDRSKLIKSFMKRKFGIFHIKVPNGRRRRR